MMAVMMGALSSMPIEYTGGSLGTSGPVSGVGVTITVVI